MIYACSILEQPFSALSGIKAHCFISYMAFSHAGIFSGLTYLLFIFCLPHQNVHSIIRETMSLFFTSSQHIARHGVRIHERRNKRMCLVLICIYMTNTCIYRSHHLVSYLSARESYYCTVFFWLPQQPTGLQSYKLILTHLFSQKSHSIFNYEITMLL